MAVKKLFCKIQRSENGWSDPRQRSRKEANVADSSKEGFGSIRDGLLTMNYLALAKTM
jgi:hypothetical protein